MILRIQKKRRKHTRFYALLTLLTGLIFVRYGLQLGIPRIILTGVIALIALLGDRNEILAIAMCCIPMHEAVDFSVALAACAGCYVLKNHNTVRINLAVVLMLVIIAWELLHCFDQEFSLMSFLFSIVPLFFLAFVLCVDVSDLDYAFVVRIMSIATAMVCLVLLANLVVRANFNIAAAIVGLQRLGEFSEEEMRSSMIGSAINPNALGIICVISIAGLWQLRIVDKSRKLDAVLIIMLLTFGAMTSSRTYLFCLIITAFLMILGQPGSIRKKIRLLFILTLTAVTALLVLNWIFPELLQYYRQRFDGGNLTGGRDVLMITYHKFISNDPKVLFFGIGRHNYSAKLTEIYRVAANIPHNAIQEVIVAWGIPGLILIMLLIGMLVVRSQKFCGNHMLLNYIPLLIILAKSMAGQLLTSHYTMLALAYAYLSLCQNFRKKEKNSRSFILQSPRTSAACEARDDLLNKNI